MQDGLFSFIFDELVDVFRNIWVVRVKVDLDYLGPCGIFIPQIRAMVGDTP